MNSHVETKKQRQYFIDWLRIALIISVFFFHIGMYFNSWHWHVKSKEALPFLEPIMSWLHLWRMPLLFLVSGVGTYYALGFRTVKKYLKERFTRLYIPLFIGIFTLVPIQVYIEKIDTYSSLGNYYLHMFEGIYPIGNFSWHHLWFLIYLLLISLVISPFLNYLRSDKFKNIKEWLIKKTSTKFGLNWVLPILILSQIILRQYFPEHTHALGDDWAYFTYYLLFFLCGFIIFTSSKVINALATNRRLYVYQTMFFTIIYYVNAYLIEPSSFRYYLHLISSISVAWLCGMAAIGYAKVYLNKDNKFRKPLNAAIYPFYLLHQPIIIVIGYVLLQWELSTVTNVFLITALSLMFSIALYWVILKYNILRIAFGMKMKPKKDTFKVSETVKSLAFDK